MSFSVGWIMFGRRPPPPAPPSMPPSSKAKDYKTDRPSEVQDELDMIRSRGVAKILNKHFTATTKRLATEKAAADAALADLERRRAQTSEFVPSKGGELNPFDSMYVELQHKRAECRRKERETLLLYQRYVHKYGKKTEVEAPVQAAVPKEEVDKSVETPPGLASPPSPPHMKSSLLEPLDENSESFVSEDGHFSMFCNKEKRSNGDAPDPPGLDLFASPKSKPKKEAEGVFLPDLQALTPQTSVEALSPQVENAVSVVTPTPNRNRWGFTTRSAAEPPASSPDASSALSPAGGSEASTRQVDNAPKGDVSIESPTSAAEIETCLTPLKRNGQASAKEDSIGGHESDSNESGDMPAREVITPLRSAGLFDEDDADVRSVVSGLTSVNSLGARQVMDDIVNEMDIFIKTETEDIRKLLDAEEENTQISSFAASSSSLGGSSGSLIGDESVRVAIKAEQMAREMQKILDDFKKDDVSEASKGSSEQSEECVSSEYPRKFETSNEHEDWTVYFDESFKREYYHEANTNRTQWEKPTSSKSRGGLDQQTLSSDMMSETLSLHGHPRRSSRRNQYRKKLRRRRRRRLVVLSFTLSCVALSCWHWKTNYAEQSYSQAMVASLHSVKDKLEYTFTDRMKREEAERQELVKLNQEQRAKEEARREMEMQRLAAEQRRREQALRQEMERKQKERAELERLEQERVEAESIAEEERKALERPWACNVPLSYLVHKRCLQLARLNPMFQESDLVDLFLQ